MSDTCWLDLRRGAPGLESHFLVERSEVYEGLQRGCRVVMLVRGEAPASFAGGFRRSKQVHLISLGSTVLAECALHLQVTLTKVKAGPQPSGTHLHSVNTSSHTSAAEIAQRFYALTLAPICATVVLAEGEFEGVGAMTGIDAIVQLLVSWTRVILACGGTPRYRPRVIVFRKRLAHLPGDLESRMTGAILATCNDARDLTSKQAEGMWRQCFSGFCAEPVGLDDEDEVCKQALALAASDAQACPALPEGRIPTLLHSACAQFSFDFLRPFNVLRASRRYPISRDLPRQLEVLYQHATSTPALVSPASRIAALALVQDIDRANLLAYKPADIFEELYQPFLDRLNRTAIWQGFVTALRDSFTTFAAEHYDGRLLPQNARMAAVQAWDSVEGKQLEGHPSHWSLCLSCLGSRPHGAMTCGHRICDSCVHRYEAKQCPACGRKNEVEIRAKPPTAGIRILSLHGTAADAPSIARLLKQLRTQLHSPLHENFDLVAASGIGLFFVLMIFCKQAPIEECIYHLSNIEYVKVTRHSLKFGRHLKFRHDEYRSSFARIVKFGSPEDCPRAFAQNLWPGCKIDVLLGYSGGTFEQTQIKAAADKLIASLFYLEPGQGHAAGGLCVAVKCRLPAGPDLANLIMRLRLDKARVECGVDKQVRQLDLCPSIAWDRIRSGLTFERTLHLRVASDSTDIVCSIVFRRQPTEFVHHRLSNCPVRLSEMLPVQPNCDVKSRENHAIVAKINKMEDQLRAFLIS
ncbi:unnamed protein product [Discula destructiva]